MFKFLWKTSWPTILLTLFAGISSGLCNAGLIATVNKALFNRSESELYLRQFVGLCFVVVITELLANYLTLRLSENTICILRMRLCKLIINASYPVLHKLGKAKILANLTNDVSTISQAFTLFPDICIHLAIVIGCICYLMFLSWQMALALLVSILAGMVIYKIFINLANKTLEQYRDAYDSLNNDFTTLTDGIKELKLNNKRSRDFINNSLTMNTNNNRKLALSARNSYLFADKFLFIFYYGIICFIIFYMPESMASLEVINAYILVLLYMNGHVSSLTHTIPLFTSAKVALNKTLQMGDVLAEFSTEFTNNELDHPLPKFSSISFEMVTHNFHNEKENLNFQLGPINLIIDRGELIFLIGGNGSGKTTLAMLLVGLYHPESGVIKLNNIEITDKNRNDYMQNFSVVFSDFYLFDELFGISLDKINNHVFDYLKLLHLHHKIKIDDGKFSSIDLSQGQRKRLALLTAYLEDRPFYVFDEWAADQDPEFKNIFYLKLLPELKANGKTVVVITHDDKYFHIADRCIKLNEGNIDEKFNT